MWLMWCVKFRRELPFNQTHCPPLIGSCGLTCSFSLLPLPRLSIESNKKKDKRGEENKLPDRTWEGSNWAVYLVPKKEKAETPHAMPGLTHKRQPSCKASSPGQQRSCLRTAPMSLLLKYPQHHSPLISSMSILIWSHYRALGWHWGKIIRAKNTLKGFWMLLYSFRHDVIICVKNFKYWPVLILHVTGLWSCRSLFCSYTNRLAVYVQLMLFLHFRQDILYSQAVN